MFIKSFVIWYTTTNNQKSYDIRVKIVILCHFENAKFDTVPSLQNTRWNKFTNNN